jgi:hypothetical protein
LNLALYWLGLVCSKGMFLTRPVYMMLTPNRDRAPTVSVYKQFKTVYMGLCLCLFMGHLVNSK